MRYGFVSKSKPQQSQQCLGCHGGFGTEGGRFLLSCVYSELWAMAHAPGTLQPSTICVLGFLRQAEMILPSTVVINAAIAPGLR